MGTRKYVLAAIKRDGDVNKFYLAMDNIYFSSEKDFLKF